MKKTLGIRREDKNRWERRVPIIPKDLKTLKDDHGIEAVVQPSDLRVYTDKDYENCGITVNEDLSGADTIFAVKEIPTSLLAAHKTYIYFSHTIKGQPYNMEMLRRLMALKCNLIDYERIVNEKNQRLIFFGAHAGYAGIIETLYACAQKLKLNGIDSALSQIKQAYEYRSLDHAKQEIKKIGQAVSADGFSENISPLIVGFTGYGNVSRGAQEIFDLLPVKPVTPAQLLEIRTRMAADCHHLYKVVFKEQDMVKPLSGSFKLQEYYEHPERYESAMDHYLPLLDILVNCIYWTEDYPRVLTKSWLRKTALNKKPSFLKVVGDISCDIEGSIEITKDATMPDNACFTYFPETDSFEDQITKNGVTVMAIDNLPCEFPKESSMFFSNVLKDFANDIVSADYSRSYNDLVLPYPIKKALILHNGELTEDYTYMKQYI